MTIAHPGRLKKWHKESAANAREAKARKQRHLKPTLSFGSLSPRIPFRDIELLDTSASNPEENGNCEVTAWNGDVNHEVLETDSDFSWRDVVSVEVRSYLISAEMCRRFKIQCRDLTTTSGIQNY